MISESEGFRVPRIPHGTFKGETTSDVGGHLGVILGAAVAALRASGSSPDDVRHMVEVALQSTEGPAAELVQRLLGQEWRWVRVADRDDTEVGRADG